MFRGANVVSQGDRARDQLRLGNRVCYCCVAVDGSDEALGVFEQPRQFENDDLLDLACRKA